jgi:hypothetical protein
MARKTYYIEISGSKLAWEANENKYKNIYTELGIKLANNSTTGLVFGANRPRMPRMRLNFESSGGISASGSANTSGVNGSVGAGSGGRSSQVVFCAPDKVKACTVDNKLKGKLSNGKKIKSASLVGVMT